MDFLSIGNSPSIDDDDHDDVLSSVNISTAERQPSHDYEQSSEQYLTAFSTWNEQEQLVFIESLLKRMQSHQHGQVNSYLSPMLQRDFVGCLALRGLQHVAEKILGYLNDQSLKSTELVCREWYHVIAEGESIGTRLLRN